MRHVDHNGHGHDDDVDDATGGEGTQYFCGRYILAAGEPCIIISRAFLLQPGDASAGIKSLHGRGLSDSESSDDEREQEQAANVRCCALCGDELGEGAECQQRLTEGGGE